ncbi:hypothetical protein [Sulfobacillus harzensis]|uniref:Uncharacterized protein n=1 Tax=Sulfobacillus harzensis TaxID=2729629 RepID=A0A7Y0L633_9FIRM|nr:hypothetical protein [Sulfobacillus harzensis]NMP23426.1 hypothetical protein [Sulfobacillus harzensis]
MNAPAIVVEPITHEGPTDLYDIVGLALETRCVPGVAWLDTTGPTGVITLTDGATFRNNTHLTLWVWAYARYPDGRPAHIYLSWHLPPGYEAITLPQPPAGMYWTLYTQTAFQRNYGNAAKWLGIAAIVGLAVYGAYSAGKDYRTTHPAGANPRRL